MLRTIEPTERCYKERDDEELRTMDVATKKRETYKADMPAIL